MSDPILDATIIDASTVTADCERLNRAHAIGQSFEAYAAVQKRSNLKSF
jgi:hypothetical protein